MLVNVESGSVVTAVDAAYATGVYSGEESHRVLLAPGLATARVHRLARNPAVDEVPGEDLIGLRLVLALRLAAAALAPPGLSVVLQYDHASVSHR